MNVESKFDSGNIDYRVESEFDDSGNIDECIVKKIEEANFFLRLLFVTFLESSFVIMHPIPRNR
jgi:hypothetical protein